MINNYIELVELVENRLGWLPPVTEKRPLYKVRAAEAGRLKKLTAENPRLYSLDNLVLAVEYLWRKRQPVKNPYGLKYYVEDALKVASEAKVERPLGDLVDEAIRLEHEHKADGWKTWEGRLVRGFGVHRKAIYDLWLEERGHAWVKT